MKCPTPEDRTHAFAQEHSWSVRALLPRLDWYALWGDEEEEDWLLYPLIPARRLIALFSSAGAGKSLLMLEMAAALSTGRKVLGHDPGRRIRVLYIDFENDPRGDVRTRLQDMDYGPGGLDYLDYLSFPSLPYLDSEAGASALLAAVEAYGPELVVIDTISRAVAGEENDNDTWLNFYKHTGLAMKQAKVALIRLDHSGKDAEKGARGGSAKSGDVDMIWRLSEVVKEERYRLECIKARSPIEAPDRELTLLRLNDPLRHDVERASAKDDREAKIVHAIETADLNKVPADWGRDKLKAWAKGFASLQGKGGLRNDAWSEVVKRRKNSAGLAFEPVDNSGKPVDNSTENLSPTDFRRDSPQPVPKPVPGSNGHAPIERKNLSPIPGDSFGTGPSPDLSPLVPDHRRGQGTGRGPGADGWPCPECNGKGFHRAACTKNPTRRVVEDE